MANEIQMSDDVYLIMEQLKVVYEKLELAAGVGSEESQIPDSAFKAAMDMFTEKGTGYTGDADANLEKFKDSAIEQLQKLIGFYRTAHRFTSDSIIAFAKADKAIQYKILTGEYKGFLSEDQTITREQLQILQDNGVMDDFDLFEGSEESGEN